jgi:GNAT superfamily N-acetyltransferase
MSITIRQGKPDDATEAAPLILSAAKGILTSIFGADDEAKAITFLQHAWRLQGGQYGCGSHSVAVLDGCIVGVVTAWHTALDATFDRATLDSITSFFSLDEAVQVLMRNQVLAVELAPPTQTQFMLGHLAVAAGCQRMGVGRMLIEHMQTQAKNLNKQSIVLDVELTNTTAIRFYQALAFSEDTLTKKFVRFVQPI